MSQLVPHRGTMILVLGIVGLVLCQVLSVFAWVMGKGDLERMDRGEMDPEGRGMTQAGMICGIVGVVLLGIGLLFGIFILVLGIFGVAASTPS